MMRTLWRDALELAVAASDPERRIRGYQVLHTDSFQVTALWRLREVFRRLRVPLANHVLRVAQTAFFGIEIDNEVVLGPGVYFVHTLGTVVGGNSRIGARVRFYGNNTVGTAKGNGYPIIEEDVSIGTGARVLGPVRVGARATIGANAVVLKDVPADSVVVGVPGRVIGRRASHVHSESSKQSGEDRATVGKVSRARPSRTADTVAADLVPSTS